jgi:opacity protein-like surface antigen
VIKGETIAMTTTRLKHTVAAFAVTVATFASATGAQAQPASTQPTTTSLTEVGSWTVTPYIGVGFSGDLDSGTRVLGVAGGYTYTPRISFEANFTYLQPEVSGFTEIDSKSWTLSGDVLYHFAGRSFVPYGAVGLGVGYASIDAEDVPIIGPFDESSTKFSFNFGGGVERQLRDKIALRGDLRYFVGGDLVPDYWRFGIGVTFKVK